LLNTVDTLSGRLVAVLYHLDRSRSWLPDQWY